MSAVGSILTNQGALQALQSISNTSRTNSSLESQLSSGLSINSPADNPAGYITAQGFTSQLNGLTQAVSNANQGVSLLQTAQGALQQQIGVVQQLNSIAVQAANGTQTPQEAQSLQNVVSQLTGQVSTISTQTQFNNINLLDGSFSGVQFQVGANEGQTINLSIGNTGAGAIGLNASTAKFGTTGVFNSTNNASSASGALTVGAAAAAYTAGALKVTSNSGNTGSATITASESAKSIAAAVNLSTGSTGVAAQASTSITLSLTAGTSGGFQFALQGSGNSQTINAQSAAALASQINGNTATSGITATLNSAGTKVTLTQSQGNNISITGVSSGSLATGGTTPQVLKTGAASGVVQGQVQLQSSEAFSTGGTANIGLNSASTLTSLSAINVSTVAGANTAINVVKFALQGLNNQGGQLGAVQQRLQANINNLNTTSQNITNALGVVQDANIPQVSNQLTQAQIQAQAGVAALKSSTTLQQSFLSLLP
ncbi:MAG: flagellin [Acidocella sp.]|nr:flagellin [Acidocella sp.]